MNFNIKGKVYDIRPAWLRRLFLILFVSWTTAVMVVGMWAAGIIMVAVYELFRTVRWWTVDYVIPVWRGKESENERLPFDYE